MPKFPKRNFPQSSLSLNFSLRIFFTYSSKWPKKAKVCKLGLHLKKENDLYVRFKLFAYFPRSGPLGIGRILKHHLNTLLFISIVVAKANALGNKIAKNMEIFGEVDHLRSWGVLCQL